MAQSDASSDRILWPLAIGSFGWLPFLVMAAGGLSLIDVLEHVFVQHLELATPFEMLLRGYQRIATILSALVEPYARQYGTLRGIMTDNVTDIKDKIEQLKQTSPTQNIISKVSTKGSYANPGTKRTVVVLDFGMKNSILRELNKRNCNAIVLPYNASISEIMTFNPDGILLSNGPGDPLEMTTIAETVAELEKHVPIFGICLGHQIFALANGAKTYKMKFGHRGFNHPVRNLQTGKIAFTSQNHGFAVDPSSIDDTDLQITHLEVNDGTVEGLRHSKYPAFSVQFHPDAAPGPHDAKQLFDKFMALIDSNKEVLTYA